MMKSQWVISWGVYTGYIVLNQCCIRVGFPFNFLVVLLFEYSTSSKFTGFLHFILYCYRVLLSYFILLFRDEF